MKPLKKMIDHLTSQSATKHSKQAPSWFKAFAIVGFASLFVLPMAVNAQTAACAANESQQAWSFAAPNDWLPQGASTLNTTLAGTPGSTVTVDAVATVVGSVALYPRSETWGGIASTYVFYVDRTTTAGANTTTFTFSKPISKLQMVAVDIDSNSNTAAGLVGKYQDQVTMTGTSPTGATVTPSAVAFNTAYVTVAGNVATSVGSDANNCPQTGVTPGGVAAGDCNVTYSFPAPITVLTLTYGNGPLASGNPPAQLVAIASLGFCVQNPDLSLTKSATGTFTAGATGTYAFVVNNSGSAATTGTTTVKDILPAGMSFGTPLTPGGTNAANWTCVRSTTTNANDTATCTSTTAIAAAASNTFTLPVAVASTVAAGTTLNNQAKVFGGGDPNKVAETTTGAISACASDGLAGSVANAGCGFEATPITAAASVVVSKTDGKTLTTAGTTNTYVVTLTNQGPSVANGVVVTDTVGAGLTCPGTNAVTCSGAVNGAVCPAASTIAVLTSAGIPVATLPVNGALQFAYICNVN